ncbi:MAG: ATP-binding protein [Rickettsiales bacterium]
MAYNTKEAEPYFDILGWVLVISYLGFYFFNVLFAAPNGYENIVLRILISSFGFIFILYKSLPRLVKKFFPLIFYFILLISFPFFFTYMLLKNQDLSAWQVKGLVGFMLLSFFVDWMSFIALSILGIALASLCSFNEGIIFHHHLIGSIGSYSAPVVYQLIFSKQTRKIQKERGDYIAKIKELNDSLENKVESRTIELEKALSYKTEFFNNLSHEIRTPVHGFTALSEGLSDNWSSIADDVRHKYVREISNNARRLGGLVNNLLDISKFTANKMLMNFELISLDKEIREIIDECNALYILGKPIEILFTSKIEHFVMADKEKLGQVIRNLLINAIRYGSADNNVININIDKIIVDNIQMVEVVVQDSGLGIPKEELEIIFEPFMQSSSTKKLSGGTGLGLSICKQIINAHKGKIWAINNLEKGASFYFSIPEVENKNIS